jgi:NAD(P)-dependent dehydrogenase (short-subunit alcohol dehydrogenase family)
MRKGSCVVTVSGAIVYAARGRYYVDGLLNNCGEETRIGRLVDAFTLRENETVQLPLVMYQSSKIALARRVRRVSSSWAAHGVNINAVAPGGVATTLMKDFIPPDADTFYYPMPALFGQNRAMDPTDVAQTLAFLVMPEAKGINGVVLFCDAGASAVYDTERYL